MTRPSGTCNQNGSGGFSIHDLRILAEYGTCTISDALDRMGIDGAMENLRPLWPGARIVGWAMPMRLELGTPPVGRPRVHLGVGAIAQAGQDGVVVVDNGGRVGMGSWGGLLSRAARSAGLAGVVTDGAVRDVDEAEALTFPTFGRAVTMRTARGRVFEAGVGEAVTCDGVVVAVGDAIIADQNGVLRIPSGVLVEIASATRELGAREDAMGADLDAGRSPAEVLGAVYESLLDSRGSAGS